MDKTDGSRDRTDGGELTRTAAADETETPRSDAPDAPDDTERADPVRTALRNLNAHALDADGEWWHRQSGEQPPAVSEESRRDQILSAACTLFAECGYHGSSLRMIARAAEISHPGMLHHFGSKLSLLNAVIDRLEGHAQMLLDATEQLGASLPVLFETLAGAWDPKQQPMSLLATLTAEIVDPDHPGRYRLSRLRLVHEHVLESALTTHAEHGRLIAEIDSPFVARTVVSLLTSLAVREHSVRDLQRSPTAEPVAEVRNFLQGYLAA